MIDTKTKHKKSFPWNQWYLVKGKEDLSFHLREMSPCAAACVPPYYVVYGPYKSLAECLIASNS